MTASISTDRCAWALALLLVAAGVRAQSADEEAAELVGPAIERTRIESGPISAVPPPIRTPTSRFRGATDREGLSSA